MRTFPFPGLNTPPSAEQKVPTTVGSDSLRILIDELRYSRQPLLQLYGNELDKSHREFMDHSASQSARGAVPSHELLRLYRRVFLAEKTQYFPKFQVRLRHLKMWRSQRHCGLWPR